MAECSSPAVFQRHEVKYLITESQRAELTRILEAHTIPDPHGESTICNIYYDTPDFRLIRRSLEKPAYKEKLRIRSYGPVRPDQTVFVELKKKYDSIVYKRRIEMPEWQADACFQNNQALPDTSQIGREIEYFRCYYEDLIPVVRLCYDRTAYYSNDDPDLRITLDRNILWSRDHLSLTEPVSGQQLLEEGQSLLEIKAASAMPLWLCHTLSSLGIRQVSFSKYGTVYSTGIRTNRSTAPIVYPKESRGLCYV